MRGVENPSTDGLATGNGQMYIVCSELTLNNTAWGSFGPTIIKPWGRFTTIVTHMIAEDLDAWIWYRSSRIEGSFAPLIRSSYGGVSTSGTGEDTLQTITLPAKHFSDPETIDTAEITRQRYQFGGLFNNFHITSQGKNTGSAGNKTIKLYWGTNVIATIAAGIALHAILMGSLAAFIAGRIGLVLLDAIQVLNPALALLIVARLGRPRPA